MTEPNDRAPLSRARLLELLDAYGADPVRWPESERAAAQALLARDPEAQLALQRAEQLDHLLDSAVALPPSAELRRKVAEIPLRAAPALVQVPALPWLFASFRRSALAATAVLALGVLAGALTVDSESTADTAVGVSAGEGVAPSEAQDDDGLDTLVELAFNDALALEQSP